MTYCDLQARDGLLLPAAQSVGTYIPAAKHVLQTAIAARPVLA